MITTGDTAMKNYFVPEGSYEPTGRRLLQIREFKEMVQSAHQSDIGVVMDVVYNYMGVTENSWFNLTVPKYYYRLDEKRKFPGPYLVRQ